MGGAVGGAVQGGRGCVNEWTAKKINVRSSSTATP